MELEWNFGDRIRKVRREAGLNQDDMAERIGFGQGSIANWESGVSQCRDQVSVAKAIERAFGVPAMWTLGLTEDHSSDVVDTAASELPDDEGLGNPVTRGYPNKKHRDGDGLGGRVTDGLPDCLSGETINDACDTVVEIDQNLMLVTNLGHAQHVREKLVTEVVPIWCASRNFSPASERQRTILVGAFAKSAGDPKCGDIDAEMVMTWWAEQRHLSPASKRSARSAMKSFVDWLMAVGAMDHNPVVAIATPRVPRKVPKVLTVEEVERLRSTLSTDVERIAIEAMLGAGLRVSEVGKLHRSDFQDDGMFKVSGKGGHCDLLPTPRRLQPLIEDKEGRLVPMLSDSISRMVKRLMAAAEIEGHTAHSLRRTFATQLLELNNIAVVQQALRHSSLMTTQHYVAAGASSEWRMPA